MTKRWREKPAKHIESDDKIESQKDIEKFEMNRNERDINKNTIEREHVTSTGNSK